MQHASEYLPGLGGQDILDVTGNAVSWEPGVHNGNPAGDGLVRDRADALLQNQGAEHVFPEERRRSRRYPFRCRLRYKSWTGTTGAGRALNMSSSGVYFITRELPLVGQPLELLIDWPVKRPNKDPLKLVVLGRVVRREEGGVAMMIQKYWFQTLGFGEPDLDV